MRVGENNKKENLEEKASRMLRKKGKPPILGERKSRERRNSLSSRFVAGKGAGLPSSVAESKGGEKGTSRKIQFQKGLALKRGGT